MDSETQQQIDSLVAHLLSCHVKQVRTLMSDPDFRNSLAKLERTIQTLRMVSGRPRE